MEDFVPYELAVKLKEKGFDYPCIGHYVNNQLYVTHYQNAFHSDNNESVDAPTIYQVLKWLRKEKRIHLVVDIDTIGYFYTLNYDITIKSNNEYTYNMYIGLSAYCDAEQAYLAGIEYVIYNRI